MLLDLNKNLNLNNNFLVNFDFNNSIYLNIAIKNIKDKITIYLYKNILSKKVSKFLKFYYIIIYNY